VTGLHDLRHTWATLALQAGVHPKVVSERLGHATTCITLDIYSHVQPSSTPKPEPRLPRSSIGPDVRLQRGVGIVGFIWYEL
jgi:integrase